MCPKFIFCVCVYEIAPIRSPSISQKLELFGNIQIMVLTGFSSFKDIFARKVSVVRWSSHPGKINLLCSIPGSGESVGLCVTVLLCMTRRRASW